MSGARITLLIPTMNRPEFLIRLMRYYRTLGFQGYICIGDSSDTRRLEQTRQALEEFRDKLKIVHREYPHANTSECMVRLLDSVSTPYVVFVADDDFLVPSALGKFALFLDNHPDYNSVHGLGIAIRLQPSGVYGQVASIVPYQQPVIEAESASQRLLDHLSNYGVTLFSVHRIESWREMFQDTSSMADWAFTNELLPCCLSVIQGKVKELDCLYLVRQGHDQRRVTIPAGGRWTESPDYLPSYRVFCARLASELARRDGISRDKAQALVEQAFSTFLAMILAEPRASRYGIPRLLQIGRYVPGAKYVWRTSRWALRSLKLIGRDEIPLAEFLSPSSPYHADFMPVYRAMTVVPDDSCGKRR